MCVCVLNEREHWIMMRLSPFFTEPPSSSNSPSESLSQLLGVGWGSSWNPEMLVSCGWESQLPKGAWRWASTTWGEGLWDSIVSDFQLLLRKLWTVVCSQSDDLWTSLTLPQPSREPVMCATVIGIFMGYFCWDVWGPILCKREKSILHNSGPPWFRRSTEILDKFNSV